MRTRVWWWRWRRNPLRRGSDRAEAWISLVAGVLLAVGAPAAGAAAGNTVREDTLRAGRDLRPTPAVVVEDAPVSSVHTGGAPDSRVLTTVRWTAPDGTSHTGRGTVAPGSEAGSPTTVWLDERGVLHNAPATPGQAGTRGVVTGLFAAAGTGTLVLGARSAARSGLDRYRAGQWEREWAAVGPTWRPHRT